MTCSRYAFFMPRIDGQFAAFNNLLFEPIVISMEEYDNLVGGEFDRFSSVELALLKEKGIIVDDAETDEKAFEHFKRTIEMQIHHNRVNILYIIPTNTCNLCCSYCFIGKLEKAPVIMSKETINNIVEKYTNYAKLNDLEKITVLFYGAEPLIAFNEIKYAIELFENKGLKPEYVIVTNGTLLHDEMAEYFAKKKVSIGLSVDGPKKYNDISRRFKGSGKSVYDQALKALKILKDHNVEYSLSVTITKEMLAHKEEFLDWLLAIGVKSIGFNLLHHDKHTPDFEDYYKKGSAFIVEANKRFTHLGIFEDRYDRKRRAFAQGDFMVSDCGAVGATQICIAPSGNVVTCHAFWNTSNDRCGNINCDTFESIISHPNRDIWKRNLTLYKAQCLKCPAFYICGGGCAKQAKDVFGDLEGIDKGFCIHTLTSLEDLINSI